MKEPRNRFSVEYRIKGEGASISQWEKVQNGSRQPKVDVTPYIKLALNPSELAERMARDLMYCEVMMFFREFLQQINDLDFERMLYKSLHGRATARKLMTGKEKSPVGVRIEDCDLPDNPFEISRPVNALYEIHRKREEILRKKEDERSLREKLFLYRLRIDELLWCLDDSNGHRAWLEDDYEKLKEKADHGQ